MFRFNSIHENIYNKFSKKVSITFLSGNNVPLPKKAISNMPYFNNTEMYVSVIWEGLPIAPL